MRAALYCRVSTATQVKEGDSIPAQLDALNKYAVERNCQIIGTFVDDGISGTKNDRDEFQRMLEMVEADKVDIILVTKMDRLHRSLRNFLNMQDILDQHHVGWIAIWEPMYDTTTPQGRMIINTMMNLAQFEAENTGQRVRQVNAFKVANREVVSGNVTPGYSIVNKHMVPNADAPDALRAFQVFDRTGSLSDTVRAMEGTALPETTAGMCALLKRRVYTGEAYGIADFCEPIVPKDLFERVQIALSRNIKPNQKRVYLFSGLIRCTVCGGTMGGMHVNNSGKSIQAYRCCRHYNRKINRCPNAKMVYEHVLERDLLHRLPNLIVEEVETYQREAAPAVSYERQKAVLEKKIERLKVLFINEEISLEEYRVDKATLLKQIAELAPVTRPEPPEAILSLQGLNISDIYQTLTREERRAFWRGIIREIRFDTDRHFYFDFL